MAEQPEVDQKKSLQKSIITGCGVVSIDGDQLFRSITSEVPVLSVGKGKWGCPRGRKAVVEHAHDSELRDVLFYL